MNFFENNYHNSLYVPTELYRVIFFCGLYNIQARIALASFSMVDICRSFVYILNAFLTKGSIRFKCVECNIFVMLH